MTGEMERRINRFLADHGCEAQLIKEYGMSEVCGIVCVSESPRDKIGSVGRPMEGCQIIAVDPDTGEQLAPGEQGELLIHSSTVMIGYNGMPEADSQVLKPGPDGRLWIWTKDIGYVEEDGTVFVTGRKKRMISRNGFKIFPNVIEECLLTSPMVEAPCNPTKGGSRLRLPQKLHDHLHLAAGELFRVLFIPHSLHCLPHTACQVHLGAEVAQGTVVVMVGIIHHGKPSERIRLDSERDFLSVLKG